MSLTRCFVFDLDGTLLDSRDAVKRAYLEAGVEMPDGVWGSPWQSWCGIAAHSVKTRIYRDMLMRGEVPTLPAMDVVRELLAADEYVGILTGASHEAVTCVMEREHLTRATLFGWSATRVHKKNRLAELSTSASRPHITYVDDEDVMWIVPPTGTFVRYVGQTNEQLKEDIGWT